MARFGSDAALIAAVFAAAPALAQQTDLYSATVIVTGRDNLAERERGISGPIRFQRRVRSDWLAANLIADKMRFRVHRASTTCCQGPTLPSWQGGRPFGASCAGPTGHNLRH